MKKENFNRILLLGVIIDIIEKSYNKLKVNFKQKCIKY